MLPARPLRQPARLSSRLRQEEAIAAAFVAIAMLLGGGGSSAPISELLLELVAAMTAAGWSIVAYRREPITLPQDRLVWTIAGLVLVLPILQLLPLPPAIWQILPGRENEVAALRLVGGDANWMPWSMTPSRTFASLLAILPAVLAMVIVASLDRAGRRLVIATVAGVALASLVLGALQLSAGESGAWRPYGNGNPGYLDGFQANRNAEADVLLFGIVALAAVLASYRRELGEGLAVASLALGGLLLVLGCLAAGSRMGIALLPLSIVAVAVIWIRSRPRLRTMIRGGSIAAAGALGAVLLYYSNNRVAHVIGRFASGHDPRENIWADTLFAISRHWPLGSGVGSFKPVFIATERLEFVDIFYPTSAHNDYLELALEGGLFGLALLAAIFVLIGWMICRAWRGTASDGRGQTIFATSVLIIVASHSTVDYPLRSMAIACIAGAAVGLLSALPKVHNKRGVPAA